MEDSLRQEMEKALEDKSEATKRYFWSFAALVEGYVAEMNANRFNLELVDKLQNQMQDKVEAHYAAYLKECADKGLPPEVGRAF